MCCPWAMELMRIAAKRQEFRLWSWQATIMFECLGSAVYCLHSTLGEYCEWAIGETE